MCRVIGGRASRGGEGGVKRSLEDGMTSGTGATRRSRSETGVFGRLVRLDRGGVECW
jgi:hypothetical protein